MTIRNILVLTLAGMLVLGGCSKAKNSSDKSSSDAQGRKAQVKDDSAVVKADDPKAEAKAAEASAGFDKVAAGMSIDEVTSIMGSPKTQVSMGEITQYHWEKGPAQVIVQFKDGKVFNKVYSADRSGSSAGAGKKVDFAKVKVGMMRDEVVKILGRPMQESGGLDGANNAGSMHWEDGKASLTVTYQNGKVLFAAVNNADDE